MHTPTPAAAQPDVSVIIPVRNGKDYIQDAIDSVVLQAYASLEILVIDDGSDDFDYDSLTGQDARIRVIHLPGNGVSHARNTGMRLARGKYFAFLDADDVWFPGKLRTQLAYFERHPHVGVVFGEFIRWQADGQGRFAPAASLWRDCSALSTADPARSGWLYTRLLLGLLVGMNTAVIRNTIFTEVGGFNESMRIGEDYDFWLRVSQLTEMHSLAGPVALYRIHGSSAMHRLDADDHLARLLEQAKERWGLVNRDGSAISERMFNERLAMKHFGHGYAHYWDGDPLVARAAFVKAFAGGARRTKSLVYCVLATSKALRADLRRRDELPVPAVLGRAASAPVAPGSIVLDGGMPSGTPWWARMVSMMLCRGIRGHAGEALMIFTFHKVPVRAGADAPSEFALDDFKRLMAILLRNFNLLPLAEGMERLKRGDLPRFSAAISFDDGYPDWLDGVVPILREHAVPATFFISTCQFEGRALWFERFVKVLYASRNDRQPLETLFTAHGISCNARLALDDEYLRQAVKYLPIARRDELISACEAALALQTRPGLFTAQHVKMLQSYGFSIGAHTVNHPILASCSDAQARTEIIESKLMLEDILREPVTLFSYPNGVPGRDIKPVHVRQVREAGFTGAVTTALGAASHDTPIFQLPRFDPWARTPRRLLIQYLMTLKRPFPLIADQ